MATATPPTQVLDEAQLAADLLKARVKARLLGISAPAIVLGRFELQRLLGRGAAGAVFEARDTQNGGTVALKVLRNAEARSVARFKAEFRGLADVVHENLVQLHELFVERGTWCFTMELVRGVPFTRHVRTPDGDAGRCDAGRLRAALPQLLSAVHAVHSAGWLHCDLKPSNVLVTETGHVVVLDFGLLTAAADLSALHAEREALGTPAYMAPELDAGHAPSAASDAYALGVVLYQALTGALPFVNTGAVLARSRSRAPAPPARDIAPDAPADLDALCSGLLERDPRKRTTVGEALAALAAEPPIGARNARERRVPLVGRDAELSGLHSAWTRIEAGQTAAVLVRGRSGVGKTALLERFAAELGPEVLLLAGRCHERESLPYKAFDSVIDGLATTLSALPAQERHALAPPGTSALVRMFPQLERCLTPPERDGARLPHAAQEQRQAAFAALKELLRRITARNRVALVVDDLQWADLDSARLLLDLLGPPAAPALLYLGAYREEEEQHSEFVGELRAHAGTDGSAASVKWLTLAPLSERAASELAAALLPAHMAQVEETAERLARDSAGIPFVLAELVAYTLDPAHEGRAAASLSELLASKLTALTAGERHALSLLSVAARPLARELLASALPEADAAARSLRRLVVGGLVQHDTHGSLVVYHDRLREHVTERLSASESVTLHRQLAQAYGRAPSAEPEWLVEHWRCAGEQALALEAAIRAAVAGAANLAFNRSASLYRAALALLPTGDARAAALHEGLAETLVNAGRSAEAATAFLAAAERSSAHSALALRCRAAQHWLRCGRKDDAVALLQDTFPRIGLRYPGSTPAIYGALVRSRVRIALHTRLRRGAPASAEGRARDRLRALGSVFREFSVYDPLRSVLFHSWFYEHALRGGDRESIFVGMAWDTYQRAFLAGARRAGRVSADLRRLDALAAELATPYARGTAAMMRGVAAMFAGAYREAADGTGRALRIFRDECPGSTWEESVCAVVYYMMIENVGPLATVCEDAPRMVRRADERIDQFTDGLLGGHMAGALLAQDRPADAQAFLRDRLSRLGGGMDTRHIALLWRMIDTQLYLGDGRGAWQTIESMWPAYLASGYDRSAFLRIFAHKRRAHAALLAYRELRDPRLIDTARREASELARSGRTDGLLLGATVSAALAHERGDLTTTRTQLSSALHRCRLLGLTIAESCCLLALGSVTSGARGRAHVEQAEAALRAQGVTAPAPFAHIYAGRFGL